MSARSERAAHVVPGVLPGGPGRRVHGRRRSSVTTVVAMFLTALTLGFAGFMGGSPMAAGLGSRLSLVPGCFPAGLWPDGWDMARPMRGDLGCLGAIAAAFSSGGWPGPAATGSGRQGEAMPGDGSRPLSASDFGRGHGGCRVGDRVWSRGGRAGGGDLAAAPRGLGDVRGGRRAPGRGRLTHPPGAAMADRVAGLRGPRVDGRCLHRLPAGVSDVDRRRRGDPDFAGLHRPGPLRGTGSGSRDRNTTSRPTRTSR